MTNSSIFDNVVIYQNQLILVSSPSDEIFLKFSTRFKFLLKIYMSTSKSTGSSRLGRDSASQRLGIKMYGGQIVKTGMIIVRQRGSKYLPGKNVKRASDDTLYAMKPGVVRFTTKLKKLFDGSQRTAKVVNVDPTTINN